MQNQGVIKHPRIATARGLAVRCAAGATLGLALACASPPPPAEIPSAESYYRRGLETLEGRRVLWFFQDIDHTRAIELFQEVIDNYPYSEYATLSELKIAEVYFRQERYEEAATYFQDFVELHPNHPQVPYAIYQRGLCSFHRMRSIDQDAAATREAVAQFRVLLERYPHSEYALDGREKMREAENRLAAHELTVADFYFDRGSYYAAEERYLEVLETYPDHPDRLRTLYRLALCLSHTGRPKEAQAILVQVRSSNPDEDLAEEVDETLRELDGRGRGSGLAPRVPPAPQARSTRS